MKKININRIKLTKEEKAIEEMLVRGEYVPVSKEEQERIAKAIEAYRKDAVLNIRINKNDLENLKQKASKLGVKYQTFIAEVLHRVAES
jgi:predicted DNA binding CopG/RHH family protein